MMTTINPDLRYRALWLVVGYLLIALVIYLSLSSSPVTIDTHLPYQDKFFHFIAYFCLTFWFMQIYHIRHHVILWGIFLFCLGVLLEYLQGFDANRYSEAADIIANTLGVIGGIGLSMTPLRFTLLKLERYLS
jgi:VanZ family protein